MLMATNDPNEAKEIVTIMLKTLKSKQTANPVKRTICEKLAIMVSTRPNYLVR